MLIYQEDRSFIIIFSLSFPLLPSSPFDASLMPGFTYFACANITHTFARSLYVISGRAYGRRIWYTADAITLKLLMHLRKASAQPSFIFTLSFTSLITWLVSLLLIHILHICAHSHSFTLIVLHNGYVVISRATQLHYIIRWWHFLTSFSLRQLHDTLRRFFDAHWLLAAASFILFSIAARPVLIASLAAIQLEASQWLNKCLIRRRGVDDWGFAFDMRQTATRRSDDRLTEYRHMHILFSLNKIIIATAA